MKQYIIILFYLLSHGIASAQTDSMKLIPFRDYRIGKEGFCNYQGQMIVPCIYDGVRKFSEGLACVWLNGKVGYINEKGEIAIPLQYNGGGDFKKGIAYARKDSLWGFINKEGKIMIPKEYEEINYAEIDFFHNDLVSVKKNGKWGYIDRYNKVVIPFKFDYAAPFSQNTAVVELNKKRFWVNKKGRKVKYKYKEIKVPPKHYAIDGFTGQEELIGVLNRNGQSGFMDKTRKIIIPCKYSSVSPFYDGLAIVGNYSEIEMEKKGMIDKTGKTIIPFMYDEIYSFSDGLACVVLNGKYGFIDIFGNFVIPPSYAKANSFSEGLAAVTLDGEKWGFIDTTGELKIPMIYTSSGGLYFRNGLCEVVLEPDNQERFRIGYINRDGMQYWAD